MITAIVQFPLPAPLTPEEAREVFRSTAPIYQGMPGLVRKLYLLSEDGRTGGGVYLWETREAAERAFDADWRRRLAERYGAEPRVAYFASPVIVDNLSGEILAD
jgi:putative monooxygenase ydhR